MKITLKKLKRKGFTLIELLIVIAIIGILASVVLVSLSGAREKAQIAAYKSQIHSLQSATLLFCDTDTGGLTAAEITTLGGAIVDKKYRDPVTVTNAANCGINSSGQFAFTTEAVASIGTGTAATACKTGNGTVANQNGVTFPVGC